MSSAAAIHIYATGDIFVSGKCNVERQSSTPVLSFTFLPESAESSTI
jgi:hypothetical protein